MESAKVKGFFEYLHSIKNSKDTVSYISTRAENRQSAYVVVGNAHQCVLASENVDFAQAIKNASIITADSQVLAFSSRGLFGRPLNVIRGWELTLEICQVCEDSNFPIALYGGSSETIATLSDRLLEEFPSLKIAASISPPFRPLSSRETQDFLRILRNSDAAVVLVGLGCPKQEMWMLEHAKKLNAVSIGVGAAFDFLSNKTKCSPYWIHRMGLEWLWRLAQEPTRLAPRYLEYNTKFIWLLICAKVSKINRASSF